jgi:xanthine dehydrogenase YagT iron-sulfur-binding subunit
MHESEKIQDTVTRRVVLEAGTATMAVLLSGRPSTALAADRPGSQPPAPAVMVELRINGRQHSLALDSRTTLLDALREHLALTGSKKGCDHGSVGRASHQLLPDPCRDARRTGHHDD